MESHATDATSLPSRVGRYFIVGHLATGGMAEILLGKLLGPSGFERPVVIKRILPHLARQKTFVQMFLDEARISAGIRHPNVVQVHELGQVENELFLVMEYLEGESAAGVMRRVTARGEPIGYDLAAFIVAEACAGLHAAHEMVDPEGKKQSLVHRDVSPQNLFVTYAGQVKVLDFGIAKAVDRLTHTQTGSVKGKFSYMSPEQCRGEPLDARSDVFSLGIVLYEVTTGRRLFKFSSDLMVLKAITDLPVPPPSEKLPSYPKRIEQICMRALAKRRDERFQSAAEMRKELLGAIRALGGDEDPGAQLGDLMQRLFPDRIAEKTQMLRLVQYGKAITEMPAAEVDESVDLPLVLSGKFDPAAFHGPEEPPTTAMRMRRARRGRVWAAVALLVLGTAAVIVSRPNSWPMRALLGRSVSTVATATAPAPAPAATGAPAAPSLVATESPTPPPIAPSAPNPDVQIELQTTPPGANVIVAGHKRGQTPLILRLPRSAARVPIELQRDGYAPVRDTLLPDVDQRLRYSLVSSSRGMHRPRGPGAAPAPAPAQPDKVIFHRFE